jgi:hypothetical protein
MNSSTLRRGLSGKSRGTTKALEAANPPRKVFGPEDVEMYMTQKSAAAKADYEKFGFEPRGEVDRLPALAEGEIMVCTSLLALLLDMFGTTQAPAVEWESTITASFGCLEDVVQVAEHEAVFLFQGCTVCHPKESSTSPKPHQCMWAGCMQSSLCRNWSWKICQHLLLADVLMCKFFPLQKDMEYVTTERFSV